MNILVLGSGGREHALTWKLSQSPQCSHLYVAPGNAGTELIAQNVALDINNFPEVAQFAVDHEIDMIVVGPEEPLVRGIRDYFDQSENLQRIKFIGPGKKGAELEGSKDFAKSFMNRHGVPTARSLTVTSDNFEEGSAFLSNLVAPYVLKADGLAAGKGVLIISDLEEAKSELKNMLEGKFGDASASVVIEEFLDGIELSVFVLTDGKDYVILPEAKDYKRIGEGDTGPNTGGMGAISPVPFAQGSFLKKVEENIIVPTIQGLRNDNIDYVGFIFIGLMNVSGDPYVIEYNVRMGDPETEAVMPRIESDLVEILAAAADGQINGKELKISDHCATTVVAVSEGYPGSYQKGKEINGLDSDVKAIVFHSGTKNQEGIKTNGGRVLAITGLEKTRASALMSAYDALGKISWDGMNFRKVIGFDIQD